MTDFKCFPFAVVWEITFACNMRCLHCGTSAGKRRPDELTTEESLKLIDELAALGTDNITLSGGEPLLREDWPVLARAIKGKGIKTCMVTNGLAVTEKTIEEFATIGFNDVGVSFDGTEKTHNYIRQREDSFGTALNAMKMMSENGKFTFCAVTQVSNINLDELDQIRSLLLDAGCRKWRIQMTTSTGRMKDTGNLVLAQDNYMRFIDKLLAFKEKDNEISVDVGENIGFYGCKGTELWQGVPYFGCYAGTRVVGIESNGNVKGCLSMPEEYVEGNIRDSSFTAIWNKPDAFAYNRQFTRETASGFCHDCRYLPLCRGGCATTSFSASGCRADNPYCTYRIEQGQGIVALPDDELVTALLARFNPPTPEGS
jgi:radical SAM protein with 4Fe4S-binding SPASM domain